MPRKDNKDMITAASILTAEAERKMKRLELQNFGQAAEFVLTEVKTNSETCNIFNVKIRFPGKVFEKFFPQYKIHFILNPRPTQMMIENRILTLKGNQTNLVDTLDSVLEEVERAKKKYAEEAEEFGMKTFQTRLKEYKADDLNASDTITFVAQKDMVQFLLEKGHLLHNMALIINDATDTRYIESDCVRIAKNDAEKFQ